MKKLIALLGAVLLAGALSCTSFLRPNPIEPNDTHMCKAACDKMAELRCPEAAPLEDGTTCQVFCEVTQKQGHALNPTCLAEIQSCSAIEACSVNREGRR